MIICGLKLTHDSSLAIIENGVLQVCVELEKINNNNRYKIINSLEEVEKILSDYDFPLQSIDRIVIDGWVGKDQSVIKITSRAQSQILAAPYHEEEGKSVLTKYSFSGLTIGDSNYSYDSYSHSAGHILSSYLTSPFAVNKENAYVLVWDGGMFPRLYYYSYEGNRIDYIKDLFFFGVNIYSIFGQHFGPFKINENVIKDELSVAGKIMAYVSFGKRNDQILSDLENAYQNTIEKARDPDFIPTYPYLFTNEFLKISINKIYSDEDVICSLHAFLQDKLIASLQVAVESNEGSNLCLAGGAALNIKWNSAIRKSCLFKDIWIPPFANDSGSSIGAALGAWLESNPVESFKWDVYQGPRIINNSIPTSWQEEPCDLARVASLLYFDNEFVIMLNGTAEIGPRALGNRSILASPLSRDTKDKLNILKYRENYRPIAPICLEEFADQIFEPGCADPFMIFEHMIREEWINKIPAVAHIDNSARLQTVNQKSNPVMYQLLVEFNKISGVPLLCNTSANLKGRGFFPDVSSAAKWGKVNYIYSDGLLYSKKK